MNLFSLFNQLLSIAILSLLSLLSPLLPKIYPTTITFEVATPSGNLTATVPTKVTLQAPTVKTKVLQTSQPVPWGTTEKIGDHLYRTYVADDPAMGTPDEILSALNNYRRSHNTRELTSDPGLCQLALRRAQEQNASGTLDQHKGLISYMDDPKHWEELNITGIGENASYGYTLSGVHLIEWIFDSDEEHRGNQLNPDWSLTCAATVETTVDIIFGRR